MVIDVVKPGDTIWIFAQRYQVSPDQIMELNGITDPSHLNPGQALVIPVDRQRHIVRQGESLWSIANLYKVSPQTLAQLNSITNPSRLMPGTVLQIPQPQKRTIESNAYLLPANSETDRTLIASTGGSLTYVSPFSYRVQENGNLQALEDQIALQAINASTAVPMMVVTNFNSGTFSPDIARAIFNDSNARQHLIDNILQTMQTKGYYSLNIDFEHLYPADREHYNDFLREIAPRVKAAGHLFSTALAPKISATQIGSWYEAHDYPVHGQIDDFVIIMTYEWGWSGGPPMAVAPIPQVRRVLEYALSVMPAAKIMMGAPLYGYDWTLPYVAGGPFARSLGPLEAVEQAYRVGARIQYDETAQAPYYYYYDSQGRRHVVWFEDARSMQAKFDLVKEYGLRGISYWVLGKPFPQNWALLKDNFIIKSYR